MRLPIFGLAQPGKQMGYDQVSMKHTMSKPYTRYLPTALQGLPYQNL